MADVETSSPATRPTSTPPWRQRLGGLVRWETLLVVLLLAARSPTARASRPTSCSSTNLFFIGLNVGEIAIMALPLTLIVITGEIDLSVASMLGLTGRLAWPSSSSTAGRSGRR